MINWKVRLKNLNFWLAGVTLPVQGVQDKLLDLINAVFGLLAILGIVNDPTTKGLGDSRRAMEYNTPN